MEQGIKKLQKMVGEENAKVFQEKLLEGFKTNKKEGEKKLINIEAKGAKEIPEGLSIEVFCVNSNNYSQFIPAEQDYMKDALSIVTASIAAKDEASVSVLQAQFEQMRPMIDDLPWIKKNKDSISYHLRVEGKKLSVDFISKDEKVKALIKEVNVKFADFYNFALTLKCGLKPGEVFNLKVEEICQQALTLYFGLKAESTDLKFILNTLLGALEAVDVKKIEKEKTQKRFRKIKKYLKYVFAFVSASVIFEYDAKEVYQNILAKILKDKADGDPEEQFTGLKMMATQMGSEMVKPFIEGMKLVDTIKALDADVISAAALHPADKNGLGFTIKLPGITKFFIDNFLA